MSARKKNTGLLIAFEGIDGLGKSTQVKLLQGWVEGLGFEVVSTREPTDGPWGRRIRASRFTQRLAPADELEAFVNDRKEHVETVILPAIERGAWVLIDRYYYSSVAYQGARGLDPDEVLKQNRAFSPIPDLVFLLDLEPKVGLERISNRGGGKDLFETLDELTRARAIFHQLARTHRHLVTLDARQTIEQVHAAVISELVRGPIFSRFSELQPAIKIPARKADYALLRTAAKLAGDRSLPIQEKVRQLWFEASA